jgi:small subunit ribosomal protein S13
MARIAGIDIPRNKRGVISLTYIYGIGRSTAQQIFRKPALMRTLRLTTWNDDQLTAIRNIINDNYKVEGGLRSEVQMNIKRLMDIGCYRGIRHRIGLPLTWSKDQEQCPYPQREEENCCQQEESNQVIDLNLKWVPCAPLDQKILKTLWQKQPKAPEALRKEWLKLILLGQAHIFASFNNIIVTLTNQTGQVISWSSAGKMGFRGSKKEHSLCRADGSRRCRQSCL